MAEPCSCDESEALRLELDTTRDDLRDAKAREDGLRELARELLETLDIYIPEIGMYRREPLLARCAALGVEVGR